MLKPADVFCAKAKRQQQQQQQQHDVGHSGIFIGCEALKPEFLFFSRYL
ncbi:hypothetical protein [Bacillus sp. RS11]